MRRARISRIFRGPPAAMGALPPATASLSDLLAPPPAGGAAGWQAPAAPAGPTIPQLAQALDRALAEDDARVGDLSSLLAAERRQQPTYTPHPAGVRCTRSLAARPAVARPHPRLTRHPPQALPLLEALAHQRVPQVVLERLNTRQVSSFCGLFPEIGRVWCAIDNVLFIWRYDAECVPRAARRKRQPPHGRRLARRGTFRAASCALHSPPAPLTRASRPQREAAGVHGGRVVHRERHAGHAAARHGGCPLAAHCGSGACAPFAARADAARPCRLLFERHTARAGGRHHHRGTRAAAALHATPRMRC